MSAKTSQLQIRVSPEEKQLIREAAERAGLSVSAYVLQVALPRPTDDLAAAVERIADHRNKPACSSCHAKIDPWGIAFENYDQLGRWRDKIKGKDVDASSRLFNNDELAGMDGLKRYLLENRQDQFVRSLSHKLTTYALGRPLGFADHSSVDAIAAAARKDGDGLATLIEHIVLSDLFQTR